MSNSNINQVMENSKWAQNKSSLLSEIHALKHEVALLKEKVDSEKSRTAMFEKWYNDYRAEAHQHKAVLDAVKDHLETLKQASKSVEVSEVIEL